MRVANGPVLDKIKDMSKKIFIHEKANVEGEVELGENASVWAFASVRGDEGKIVIGSNSNIQESAVVHGKTEIGNNVTIAHGAVVHGAKVGNNVLVGINSTVLDGASIGDWCIIAAGSVVTPDTKIASGGLVMGIPGKVVRPLADKDKDLIKHACENYLGKIE